MVGVCDALFIPAVHPILAPFLELHQTGGGLVDRSCCISITVTYLSFIAISPDQRTGHLLSDLGNRREIDRGQSGDMELRHYWGILSPSPNHENGPFPSLEGRVLEMGVKSQGPLVSSLAVGHTSIAPPAGKSTFCYTFRSWIPPELPKRVAPGASDTTNKPGRCIHAPNCLPGTGPGPWQLKNVTSTETRSVREVDISSWFNQSSDWSSPCILN